MRGHLVGAIAVVALVLPATAGAGSLPDDRFGERPGPPLLYRDLPVAPELSVEAPFQADPLLVSGTDAYRDGEYLYQDYLFDDHGADTGVPDLVTAERKPGPDNFSTSSGDVLYPTDERYRANAADLVELRVRPTSRALVYRATFSTVVDEAVPALGIAIDTNPGEGGGLVAWRNGAGISSPGLDLFVTAWDAGGELHDYESGETTDLPQGAVSVDARTNQMTIRVPRSLADPGQDTWRHFAGVGLWDAPADEFTPVRTGPQPTEDEPASGSPRGAPAILNLAFRFDEPQFSEPIDPDDPFGGLPPPSTGPGTGNWYESRQAEVLASREVRGFRADVDFGRLAGGPEGFVHAPGETQARIMPSDLDLPEGVTDEFPEFGGRLQPYVLRVPDELGDRPAGLTFSLHSLGGTYTQYAVFSPNQLEQFGDDRANLVVTPLGHGPDGWYTDEGEADFFEVWRDVASHFTLDPDRVYPSGYSMGGYGTYKLGVEYPDLFARAFTTVGPPGLGIWLPPAPPEPGGEVSNSNRLLENVRSVPYMNWVGAEDQLVPYPGPLAQQARFDALGLRSTLETFQTDHFGLAILDEWGAARDFLGDARVKRRPSRVDYAFMPGADRPKLGLRHDHAYWLSGMRARDLSGTPQADPARGEVDAVSQAFGEGEPQTEPVRRIGTEGRPSPSVVRGMRWTSIPSAPERNRLLLSLDNVRRVTVHGRGAKLDGAVERNPLRVRLESDGEGRLRLDLRLPEDAVARRIDGGPVGSGATGGGAAATAAGSPAPEVALSRRGADFRVADGEREYRIFVPASSGGEGPDGGGGGDDDGADSGGAGSTTGGGSSAGGPTDAVARLGATAGSGDGGSLPFTGLALLALVLLGSVALLAGRMLRRAA